MKRKIIAYKHYFEEFFYSLDAGTQDKILYVLTLLRTQDRLPVKFMKIIRDGLYELRVEYNSNIYRVFFIFDEGKVVILFNGFQKKTQKTPNDEIKKALKLKEEYYGSKRKQ
jgi:phage-related protein